MMNIYLNFQSHTNKLFKKSNSASFYEFKHAWISGKYDTPHILCDQSYNLFQELVLHFLEGITLSIKFHLVTE